MIEPDLTVKQVALIFGVTTTVVYRLIKQGKIEAYRVGTGAKSPDIRITAQSVNEYKSRNRVQPQKNKAVGETKEDAEKAA